MWACWLADDHILLSLGQESCGVNWGTPRAQCWDPNKCSRNEWLKQLEYSRKYTTSQQALERKVIKQRQMQNASKRSRRLSPIWKTFFQHHQITLQSTKHCAICITTGANQKFHKSPTSGSEFQTVPRGWPRQICPTPIFGDLWNTRTKGDNYPSVCI